MARSADNTARPLSPHLGIYKNTITMAMSIAHRITGVVLYGGMFVLMVWLLTAAIGAEAYAAMTWILTSILGTLGVFVFTWALLHHAMGGIRHFIWDAGAAFDRSARFKLGWMTIIGSSIGVVLLWLVGAMV